MKIKIGQIVKTPDGIGVVSDTLFGDYQVRFSPGVFVWYRKCLLKKVNQCIYCAGSAHCNHQNSKVYICDTEELQWQ